MYQGIFFDISGVLHVGQDVVPGAVEAVQRAQRSELQIRFVTNTSRRTRQQLVKDLCQQGFDIDQQTLFTACTAAHRWLANSGLRPYCLTHPAITSEFSDLNQRRPNAVLITDAADAFSYAALDHAFQLCQQGAPLVGIGLNRYFKEQGELHLDAGPFIKAIEYAADIEAVIIGKPSADFFHQVVASTGLEPSSILMIGDDVHGDIEGALAAGLSGCLVKTGKYQAGDEDKIEGQFACVESVVEAVELALAGEG